MKTSHRLLVVLPLVAFTFTIPALAVAAQNQKPQSPNQVLGEVQFVGTEKPEKSAGVWIDGQYVGYVSELRDNKKVMLLPGQHEISFRQTGYLDGTQTYVVEPAKKLIITVKLDKDPKAQFATVTSEIQIAGTRECEAVFVDGDFAG